jgi:GxxExxY protein
MSGNGGGLVDGGLTDAILGVFYDVFNGLGYGFLENPYVLAMERDLTKLGLQVGREVGVRLLYRGEFLCRYKLDLVINERVVVEVKSSYELHKGAQRQLYNYLRATNLEVGLLLHFGPEPKFYRVFCPNSNKPGVRSD